MKNDSNTTAGSGLHDADCSLSPIYDRLAIFEVSCLLVTLQCGISPTYKDPHRHVVALIELLRLSGKIPQYESLTHTSAVTPEISEDLREIKETARRQMERHRSSRNSPEGGEGTTNTGREMDLPIYGDPAKTIPGQYTGHVPCKECGRSHWMYGAC